MVAILERRYAGLQPSDELFKGGADGYLSKMADLVRTPAFILHDLHNLLATVGERLDVGDAVLRRCGKS